MRELQVEYRINLQSRAAFLAEFDAFAVQRRRDGAYAWGVFEDIAEPGRFLETFFIESWLEHLRQHERVTRADRELQERVQAFHIGPGLPMVSHLIAASPQ